MNSGRASRDFWEEIEPDEALVGNAIHLASRDLKTAEHVLNGGDYDWSLAISYNAMLQAGRALMFSEGVRSRGESRHFAVIEFRQNAVWQEFP